jgi:hypothetical protein
VNDSPIVGEVGITGTLSVTRKVPFNLDSLATSNKRDLPMTVDRNASEINVP